MIMPMSDNRSSSTATMTTKRIDKICRVWAWGKVNVGDNVICCVSDGRGVNPTMKMVMITRKDV